MKDNSYQNLTKVISKRIGYRFGPVKDHSKALQWIIKTAYKEEVQNIAEFIDVAERALYHFLQYQCNYKDSDHMWKTVGNHIINMTEIGIQYEDNTISFIVQGPNQLVNQACAKFLAGVNS